MLTTEQQTAIIKSVVAGSTWSVAAEGAGLHPETLLQIVFDVRSGKMPAMAGFVEQLRQAGEKATESSLKQHARGRIHA